MEIPFMSPDPNAVPYLADKGFSGVGWVPSRFSPFAAVPLLYSTSVMTKF